MLSWCTGDLFLVFEKLNKSSESCEPNLILCVQVYFVISCLCMLAVNYTCITVSSVYCTSNLIGSMHEGAYRLLYIFVCSLFVSIVT